MQHGSGPGERVNLQAAASCGCGALRESSRSTIRIITDGVVIASSCNTVRWRSTASLSGKPVLQDSSYPAPS